MTVISGLIHKCVVNVDVLYFYLGEVEVYVYSRRTKEEFMHFLAFI